jgi:hypothetical protein
MFSTCYRNINYRRVGLLLLSYSQAKEYAAMRNVQFRDITVNATGHQHSAITIVIAIFQN